MEQYPAIFDSLLLAVSSASFAATVAAAEDGDPGPEEGVPASLRSALLDEAEAPPRGSRAGAARLSATKLEAHVGPPLRRVLRALAENQPAEPLEFLAARLAEEPSEPEHTRTVWRAEGYHQRAASPSYAPLDAYAQRLDACGVAYAARSDERQQRADERGASATARVSGSDGVIAQYLRQHSLNNGEGSTRRSQTEMAGATEAVEDTDSDAGSSTTGAELDDDPLRPQGFGAQRRRRASAGLTGLLAASGSSDESRQPLNTKGAETGRQDQGWAGAKHRAARRAEGYPSPSSSSRGDREDAAAEPATTNGLVPPSLQFRQTTGAAARTAPASPSSVEATATATTASPIDSPPGARRLSPQPRPAADANGLSARLAAASTLGLSGASSASDASEVTDAPKLVSRKMRPPPIPRLKISRAPATAGKQPEPEPEPEPEPQLLLELEPEPTLFFSSLLLSSKT